MQGDEDHKHGIGDDICDQDQEENIEDTELAKDFEETAMKFEVSQAGYEQSPSFNWGCSVLGPNWKN